MLIDEYLPAFDVRHYRWLVVIPGIRLLPIMSLRLLRKEGDRG
jgi:hypothetical protein